MQKINITTRIIIICGPTSSGKTTMANRIKNEFSGKAVVISHDDVLAKINQNQPQEKIDEQFRLAFFNSILEAYQNKENQLIIIDSKNIRATALMAFIQLFYFMDARLEEISIIKLWIPEQINLINAINHYPDFGFEYVIKCTTEQRRQFSSLEGSLLHQYVRNETILQNPEYEIIFQLS